MNKKIVITAMALIVIISSFAFTILKKEQDFIRPAEGNVTNTYGHLLSKFHHAIDIGPMDMDNPNVPIVATADGIVTRSYFSKSYGNVVYIQHEIKGKRYESVYAHMDSRNVEKGTKVKQGQVIGIMGSTGQSNVTHLHFELHKDKWTIQKENSLNPMSFIAFEN
ncbi:M23 family metallopeptidase [Alkalihalobacillus sp. BA299]|uniref:M23 family metallopeptidase n=1 Tax=Alkalihalobacillus sp. BA299 TaxID=2815938 RepID=UPI001ADC0781|nr:M23 family metallopeptidase [Alkalihalobacillus sp. BA299]